MHTQANITDQPNCSATIDANILTCKVEPDDVGLRWNEWGLSMIETKIHTCPNSQDCIGSFQCFAAGCCEEERVCWWQATTSSTIEKDRGVDAFCKLAQWFRGITPPDGRTRHNDRVLCFF